MATIKMDAVSRSTRLLMNLWTAFIGLLKAGLRAHTAVHSTAELKASPAGCAKVKAGLPAGSENRT
jgi:hypothetical protein